MKTERLLILLTAVNTWIVACQLVRPTSGAAASDVPDVIRARALQIVDDRGRVRASLAVVPEDTTHLWKGEPYPETVLLRLITADGRPNVKLSASRRGASLVIGGEADPTYVQVLAEGGESRVKLIDKNGTERLIQP